MASICEITQQKIKLDYPCEWEYKVIIFSEKSIHQTVNDVLDKRECKIKLSNKSKEGKFVSYTLSLLVHSEDDRHGIYEMLKKHDHVKIVL